jgi:MarR family transcriptional regulator, negative regulator of the multidrug operon emrRAB
MEFVQVEASLERLRTRVPDIPISEMLLSLLLLDSGRGIVSMLEQQVRPFDLAEAEFRVLAALFSQPDGVAKLSELCAQTSQSASQISRISEALVGRGLITRGPPSAPDRRKRILRTTEQGEELARRLLPTLIGRVRAMFNDFSVDDQQQLIMQLKRLNPKLDKALEQLVPR